MCKSTKNNMNNGFFTHVARLLGFNSHNNGRFYTSQQMGTTVPVWVNTTNKWILYSEIPELQAVINRYSKMVSSANPIVCDEDGNRIYPNGHWIFNLIDRPNSLQSWGNLMYMTAINKCVTNNALIYAPSGSMGNRQNLTPLAWNNVKIVATGSTLRQTETKGIIEKFEIPTSKTGLFGDFKPDEVIYITEPDGINLFDTNSKLDALKYPLSNIAAAYKKRNVLLVNLFALGVLTMEKQDGLSFVPLNSDDKKALRDDIMKRNDGKPVITDKSIKWEPMSFPTKDLMLFEEMTADKVAIIDAFGLNENMFGHSETKGSTFSNVEMGEKQAYNSTIIPDTEIIYDEFTKQLKLDKEGMFLRPSFEHISVLKSDEGKSAEAMFKRSQAVEKISSLVTLSNEERRTLLGI